MEFNVSAKLLDACVLGILSTKDTYGYDLTQQIGKLVEVSETALYPVLRRLLKDGLLTTYDKPYDGRNRKYYKITDQGQDRLSYYKSCWDNYKTTIDSILEGGEKYE